MNAKPLVPGLVLSCVMLALIACSPQEESLEIETPQLTLPSSGIAIKTLSTMPWLISGGDVLLAVELESGSASTQLSQLRISLNGEDISAAFSERGGRLEALLGNLPEGDSTLAVVNAANGMSETLALTNYPISGPLISGEHETPFFCQTEEFQLAVGQPLGVAQDENCFVPTRIDYVYWSAEEEQFKPFRRSLAGAMPQDLAQLTVEGEGEQPFIVRVETGTVNRAIYEIAMVHNPADGEPSPWQRSRGWNGKLVYTHGGGCRGGWYQQGTQTGGVLRRDLLEMGYALTSSTLNVFGQNCNDLLASETHIMVKERFVEHYGVPIYTIGTGGSGGSYQSHQTADNYPGVFDGIIVSSSFPDVTSATIFTVADSRLLNYYFSEVDPELFSAEQQLAISGFGALASIPNLSRGAARLDPIYGFDTPAEEQGGELSVESLLTQRYHPSIPLGLRATVYDHSHNVYGRLYDTYTAKRPLDNIGVQYGLAALNDGVISPDQFIALNRGIGGFDRDMNHIPQRHKADQDAAYMAIASGRILNGGGGLASTPVIDYRSYTDHAENGDIHMIVHQFSTRQRLINANGHADNHVMTVGGRWGFDEAAPDLKTLFEQMDAWLMALVQDSSDRDLSAKVVAAKPASLVDSCWDNTSEPRINLAEPQSYEGVSRCAELYPRYSTPRHVAGAPLANDIVSCVRKTLNPRDYAVEFSAEQWQQLQEVFPAGVCDWTRGDANGAAYQGSWLSVGPSPVNQVQVQL